MSEAQGTAREQLRAFVARIEKLEEEKKTIADDIKDVYGEAKAMGFDTKILKMVISLRKKDEQQRTEEEIILDTYLQALGMIPAFEREEDKPVTAAKSTAARKDVPSETSEEGRQLVGNEKCQDKREEASHLQAGTQALPVDTNSAPASQGEADAPSDERVSPNTDRSSAAANVGGDHVTETPRSADIRPGLVSNPPAHHPVLLIRPHCQHPGEAICGGSGRNHCRACTSAMRERELEPA